MNKLGKDPDFFKDTYCVKNLADYEIRNSNDGHQSVKFYDKINLDIKGCTGRPDCVTDQTEVEKFFDKFYLTFVMIYPQAAIQQYKTKPIVNVVKHIYKV